MPLPAETVKNRVKRRMGGFDQNKSGDMDNKTFNEVVKITGQGLRHHTLAFNNIKTGGWGTGTLVKIGEHLLIATAGHLIPSQPACLALAGEKTMDRDRSLHKFISQGLVDVDRIDVGFLELDPDTDLTHLAKTPVGLDRLSHLGTGRAGEPVLLMGAPVASQRKGLTPAGMFVKAAIQPYVSTPIAPEKWPVPPEGIRQGHVDVDVFMEYPSDKTLAEEGYPEAHLPHPGGASGGGLWDIEVPAKNDELKGVVARFFAIQTGYYDKQEWIRATQVVHWLRLIHVHYPGLRREIAERFPAIENDQPVTTIRGPVG